MATSALHARARASARLYIGVKGINPPRAKKNEVHRGQPAAGEKKMRSIRVRPPQEKKNEVHRGQSAAGEKNDVHRDQPAAGGKTIEVHRGPRFYEKCYVKKTSVT